MDWGVSPETWLPLAIRMEQATVRRRAALIQKNMVCGQAETFNVQKDSTDKSTVLKVVILKI
jgi:hypothetical protein